MRPVSLESQEKVLNQAAALLEYQNRSSQALFERLLEKGAEERDAAYAVAKLQELGYLDDARYGALIVRDLTARGYGKGRVRQKLREKKVDEQAIQALLETYEPDREKLAALAASRLRGKQVDRRELKRTADALFRRGFSWGEIQEVLREYQEQTEDVYDD